MSVFQPFSNANEFFFVLRFVALKGHHDTRHTGISIEQKRILINSMSKRGKVFITSENPIETEFEKYRIKVSTEKIHSVLYFASAFVGDSQTMTSEAAVLGTPAFKCNSFAGKLSVPNELEKKYELCYSYQPSEFHGLIEQLNTILNDSNSKEKWKQKVKYLWKEKIDVSTFIFEFITTY